MKREEEANMLQLTIDCNRGGVIVGDYGGNGVQGIEVGINALRLLRGGSYIDHEHHVFPRSKV